MENYKEMKIYLKKSGNRDCNFSAGNIIIWGQGRKIAYTIVHEVIVFRTLEEKTALYHVAEFNERFPEIVCMLAEDAKDLNREMHLASLTKEMAQALEEYYPDCFHLEFDRDGCDYVYETQQLAELKGKKYHKKKNHVNKFLKSFDFSYEEITEKNREECLEMAARWREGREMTPSLQEETRALELAFRHYEELGFSGGLLRVNGEVMAFTLGESVTEDTFVTHFEKALDSIPQLYAAMNQQFADKCLRAYRYVNREEDLGLEGLRKAKESYHPTFMVEKYKAVQSAQCKKHAISRFCREKLSKSA